MDTKHNTECVMAFGRLSPAGTCPRCDELRAGAPARAGWGRPSAIARRIDERIRQDIRRHMASDKHRSGGCGPVCTFGDW